MDASEKHLSVCLLHTGSWPATQACALVWELNQRHFDLQAGTQPLSHNSQGPTMSFLEPFSLQSQHFQNMISLNLNCISSYHTRSPTGRIGKRPLSRERRRKNIHPCAGLGVALLEENAGSSQSQLLEEFLEMFKEDILQNWAVCVAWAQGLGQGLSLRAVLNTGQRQQKKVNCYR